MSVVSLLHIGWRNIDVLKNLEKELRISRFYTPSSFYVQLVEEDVSYTQLEADMLDYYSVAPLYYYCKETGTLQTEETDERLITKLYRKNLQPKMMIAIQVNGKWVRCITKGDPRMCQNMDTGEHYMLGKIMEMDGIYELEANFLYLPPRAVLCGLDSIIPHEIHNHRWSLAACRIFQRVTETHRIHGYFSQTGFLPNSAYLTLFSCGENESVINVNMILVGFNAAVQDFTGSIHPLYTKDTPWDLIDPPPKSDKKKRKKCK